VTTFWIVLGSLFIGLGLVAGTVFIVQRNASAESEPYHPLFAESPDPDPVVQQFEENGDTFGWQRSKYFTDEEAAALDATATPPAVVAGEDPRMSILMGQIERACHEYREGVDICATAVREPSPEVKR